MAPDGRSVVDASSVLAVGASPDESSTGLDRAPFGCFRFANWALLPSLMNQNSPATLAASAGGPTGKSMTRRFCCEPLQSTQAANRQQAWLFEKTNGSVSVGELEALS